MSTSATELKEVEPGEKEVLAAFYDRRELSPSELVQRVVTTTSQLTDVDIKRAVWHLIAKGEIRLSAEQQLSAVQKGGREAA